MARRVRVPLSVAVSRIRVPRTPTARIRERARALDRATRGR